MQITRIHDLIEPTLRAMDLVLWACELHQQGNQSLLRITVDRENGSSVTLDDCVSVSRVLGAILDVEDPIKNRYQLEVSSPGLDRALLTLAHFQKYVGSHIKIKLRYLIANRKQFEARIEKIVEDKIFLVLANNAMISVVLNEIAKANLL